MASTSVRLASTDGMCRLDPKDGLDCETATSYLLLLKKMNYQPIPIRGRDPNNIQPLKLTNPDPPQCFHYRQKKRAPGRQRRRPLTLSAALLRRPRVFAARSKVLLGFCCWCCCFCYCCCCCWEVWLGLSTWLWICSWPLSGPGVGPWLCCSWPVLPRHVCNPPP